jgi:lysophospholipid acyltransferase (LPLAT)-like uncharacterized protein
VRNGLKYALAQHGGGAVLDTYMGTLRWQVENADAWRRHVSAGQPVIYVLWHSTLLPIAYTHRGQGVVSMTSQSADGEYISRLLQHWGNDAARGSSSKGGDSALREMVRAVRSGHSAAITPDGPRGPREVMKPGVVQLAQLSGAPLVPVSAGASSAWRLSSWDRFLVPKPFSRVHVAYGEPVLVKRGATREDLDAVSRELEQTMAELMKRVG